jgi:hypothetical protein
VIQESRFLLSQDQDPTGAIGEALEHAPSLSLGRLGCTRCRCRAEGTLYCGGQAHPAPGQMDT